MRIKLVVAIAAVGALLASESAVAAPTIHGGTAVAIGPSGDVYVGDAAGTVTRIHPGGRLVSHWSLPPSAAGSISALAVAPDGSVDGLTGDRTFARRPGGRILISDPAPACTTDGGPHASPYPIGIAADAAHVYVGRDCDDVLVYDRSLHVSSTPAVGSGRWPLLAGTTLYTTSYEYLSGAAYLQRSTLGDETTTSVPVRAAGGSYPTALSNDTFVRLQGDFRHHDEPYPMLLDRVDGTEVGDITGTGATSFAAARGRIWYVTGADDVRVIPLAPGVANPRILTPDDESSGYGSRR